MDRQVTINSTGTNEVKPADEAERVLAQAKSNLIRGVGRISNFWGLNKAMGELYGLLYLSLEPLSLDQMAEALNISKASVSIHVRALERVRMVRKIWAVGDRRDYYEAEIDFWEIAKGIFREREAHEFNEALNSVTTSLEMVRNAQAGGDDEQVKFYLVRLKHMQDFFKFLDKLIRSVLTLEELRLSSLARLGRIKGEDTDD
jgi:HTH-type transcriptional regulator, glycine betaine synthesis regulator